MADMSYYQWQFLLVVLAGWINRYQQDVIEYLMEENRIHKELHGGKRLCFTDEQRRRLAAKAKAIGRGTLKTLDCIVTPDTLLRWYRKLIARKYDGSKWNGGPRPGRKAKMVEILIRMAKENPSCGYTGLRDMLMNRPADNQKYFRPSCLPAARPQVRHFPRHKTSNGVMLNV
jgi:hypothetical protein